MTIASNFPCPEDDDADYTELLPLDLSRFLDAIERTPAMPGGFGLHDVHKVELAWEFLDMEAPAHGYLVDLVDGRRVLLEALHDPENEATNTLSIETLASGALPARLPSDESLAPWYKSHHIALHIAELKLLPHDD
jgi:hypothetical protein